MKVVTGIGGWPSRAPAQARKAEQAGFDCVTCGELAHDSMLTMALAATATDRIGLQTSVTIAFPRSPMVLAMEPGISMSCLVAVLPLVWAAR